MNNFLLPLSWMIELISRIRVSLYQAGPFKQKRLPAPAISVGNLSLGGTGKTPVVAFLARLLQKSGYQPVILSRGYRSSSERGNLLVSDGCRIFASARECGDEPLFLARKLPGVSIAVGRNRYRSALLRPQWTSPGTVFLLDDGYQHLQVLRQLDLLLVDATDPFSNGRVFPAGRLREPLQGISRADAVLITRSHLVSELHTLEKTVRRWNPEAPIFRFSHRIAGVSEAASGARFKPSHLEGHKVLALAAIARPDLFVQDLRQLGAKVVGNAFYRDHHILNRSEQVQLRRKFHRFKAEAVVTTEKDLVRLPISELAGIPVYALEITAQPERPAEFLAWFEETMRNLSQPD